MNTEKIIKISCNIQDIKTMKNVNLYFREKDISKLINQQIYKNKEDLDIIAKIFNKTDSIYIFIGFLIGVLFGLLIYYCN